MTLSDNTTSNSAFIRDANTMTHISSPKIQKKGCVARKPISCITSSLNGLSKVDSTAGSDGRACEIITSKNLDELQLSLGRIDILKQGPCPCWWPQNALTAEHSPRTDDVHGVVVSSSADRQRSPPLCGLSLGHRHCMLGSSSVLAVRVGIERSDRTDFRQIQPRSVAFSLLGRRHT